VIGSEEFGGIRPHDWRVGLLPITAYNSELSRTLYSISEVLFFCALQNQTPHNYLTL